MNVLIAYASRLGATAGIAERIGARLETHDVRATARPVESARELIAYDAFVIGSAVYAGHWLREAVGFIRDHRSVLASHPVWLFSSGPVGRSAAKHDPVEPAEIRELTKAVYPREHRIFFGALDRRTIDSADLGFAERFVAKRFIPEGDFRDWPQIDAWADEIANELLVVPALRR
jgi:menaquinone-dependent protoporphyrinogen oxidase